MVYTKTKKSKNTTIKAGMGSLCKVWEVRTLKLPRQDECQKILQKIANQVEPILMRRGWKVRLLTEFSPKDRGLLGMNVNRGQKILIRMRPAHSPNSFYPYEHLLGTMLHELAHMEVGPHNAAFQKLWDDLWNEVEQLMDQGITGQSGEPSMTAFSGEGHTLGGKKVNKNQLGKAMAQAAERRAQVQGLMTAGGVRLGGSDPKTQDLRRRIRAAAQRRNLGSTCGVVSNHVAEKGPRRSCGTSRNEGQPSQRQWAPSSNWTCKKCTVLNGAVAACAVCGASYLHSGVDAVEWECAQCTLKNKGHLLDCSICGQERGGLCSTNSLSQDTVQGNWECQSCTYSNPARSSACDICESPALVPTLKSCEKKKAGVESLPVKCKQWRCSQCTLLNEVRQGSSLCTLCGNDRRCKSKQVCLGNISSEKGSDDTTKRTKRKRDALSVISENTLTSATWETCAPETQSCAWLCSKCTFMNPSHSAQCQLCQYTRTRETDNNQTIRSQESKSDTNEVQIVDLCMF